MNSPQSPPISWGNMMGKLVTPDYAELSPYALLRDLPQLAANTVPTNLRQYCTVSGLKAWQLLEEAVFYFFRQVLMLDTLRMGAESLFKHEPEGIVLVNRTSDPFALMYECKSRKKPYVMSSDDVLRYRDYIRRKKTEVKERQHLDLSHFIIVAGGFGGNTQCRLSQLEAEGVIVCLVPADCIHRAYLLVRGLDYPDIVLLDHRKLFVRGLLCRESLARCFGSSALEAQLTAPTDLRNTAYPQAR